MAEQWQETIEPGYDVYEYSRRGRLRELKEVLSNGNADAYMAYDGSTALVMAARGGFHQVVAELIAHKASLDVRTEDGSNVLSHAVSGGSLEAVKMVLATKVDVDDPNEDGVTPLILAAYYGKAQIIEALCDAGADVNRSAEGWGSALDCATGEAVQALESRGARRSVVKTGGLEDQPIAAAAERFCYGCFESGEDPNGNAKVSVTPSLASSLVTQKIVVGDRVELKQPKSGLLQQGDVGTVVEDDGSDCLPLKVKFGESHDYYNHGDLSVCAHVELPPDSDRATVEGTARFTKNKKINTPSCLGSTGLSISPVGFGGHRLSDVDTQKDALCLAIQVGCNIIDLAPNYTDGQAETVVGVQLEELISSKKVRRDEVVIMSKVGNVVGNQLRHSEGVPNMAQINDNLFHCISPAWIEQELTRSLQRLRLTCIDCLLLHCPEYEVKAGVEMTEIYTRLKEAFKHLESEVSKGRIAMYGVSAAFFPLRPTDPEHLDLNMVMQQLPDEHHFRLLQFPLNFAEAQILTVSHTPRTPDGIAIDKESGLSASTLFEAARAHGLATLINRPLDGIYKESSGVLRFSSLDTEIRAFSELQLDNCDALEEKLTNICKLDEAPYNAGEGASGQLAAKTVKVLCSLKDVDCVLLGMRQPEYVLGTLPLAFGAPPVPEEKAKNATRAVHDTVKMWFATAINEADHGTAKEWRLPAKPVEEQSKMIGA